MTVRPDIGLLGYTGAGPYPQTYYTNPSKLAELVHEKKYAFFERYKRARDYFDPRVTIPFAGKYLLGGRLAPLNPFRGVADATEVMGFCVRAVVLDDGGDATIDTETFKASRVRTAPYAAAAIAGRMAEIAQRPMAYEVIPDAVVNLAPLERLLRAAVTRASARSSVSENYYFVINQTWVVNARQGSGEVRRVIKAEVSDFTPRSEIEIDPRHLVGLLTGMFHWNNAEVGSHFRTRREPDAFNREAQRFLDFLAVV